MKNLSKILFMLLCLGDIQTGFTQSISFSPSSGQKGSTFQVTVTSSGNIINFAPGTTTCVQILANPTTLSLSEVNVTSDTTLTGTLSIPDDHTIGTYDGKVYYTGCSSCCVFDEWNCTDCFTIEPCSTVVTTVADTGPGSLRAVMACAEPLSTITFDPGVNSQSINIAIPAIIVNKEINLFANPADNITISAFDPNNLQTLMEISQPISIGGLKLEGNTSESLIFNVAAGGSLNLENTEINRVSINNN